MTRRQGNICLQPYWCQTPIWNVKVDAVLMLTKRKTSAQINLTALKSLSEITSSFPRCIFTPCKLGPKCPLHSFYN